MSDINKKSLKHLADLAHLELTEKEEEKFLKELESILGHFKELESLDTSNVTPMTGGTSAKNVLRGDLDRQSSLAAAPVVEAFPDKAGGHLKVPSVFKEE
ncbi:MAG: aspartyl-tRNA(Asn)/glutamyl-tRNA (Gln) amidotransferase subunit C [Parcubacteria group bacterium Gr01-1014_19]|nr:MAG: aspartyl-tRNA(Asn)/glutamyl-tRNA (Gln) amidotransferase subunit C [Parcubacteria group bacterium Gr01-1014_19]